MNWHPVQFLCKLSCKQLLLRNGFGWHVIVMCNSFVAAGNRHFRCAIARVHSAGYKPAEACCTDNAFCCNAVAAAIQHPDVLVKALYVMQHMARILRDPYACCDPDTAKMWAMSSGAAGQEPSKPPKSPSQAQSADNCANDDRADVQLRMQHLACVSLLLHTGAALTHKQHAKLCHVHTILCPHKEGTASQVTAAANICTMLSHCISCSEPRLCTHANLFISVG